MSLDMNPELPPGWDLTKVIPGELEVPDDLSGELDDDIAPGVLLPYEPAYPVLRKTGSAAMVVAKTTGRAVGLSVRGTGTTLRWFFTGAVAVGYLGRRYIRTHDFQESVGGIQKKSDWNQNKAERRSRWKVLGWAAGVTVGLNLTGWWALVKYGELTAVDSWWMTPATFALAAFAAVSWYGRYRLNNTGLAPEQIIAEQDDPNSDEPFPLAMCRTADRVEECVSRALAWEGISTRSVRALGHREWGWEIDVVTPDDVNAKTDKLDRLFGIKRGGTLTDPDPQDASHLVLRLVTANPFENMPTPVLHAPNSLDITHAHNFGRCMDASPLNLVLEGLRILAIGVSGAAKTTGVLRDLAEIITACHNAIALDLDPVKDGLREFEGAMAVPPIRGNRECEKWLEYLVKMAKARNTVRNRLNMGDTWVATADHPAIFPFVDEFIYLSQKAKELFIELLRLAKQSGIYPIAAGQDATSDSMGDAIADSFTLRIMLAARHADIPLVLGSGAIAAGYRPDRLVPAQNKDIKNDAGQSYIKGPGLDRPLLYGWNEHSNEAIKRAVADRVKAGRPWFDRDTLAAAGLLHLATGGAAPRIPGDRQIAQDAVSVMADRGVDRMRTETLAKALADFFPGAYEDLTAAELRSLLRDAGGGSPIQLGPCEGEQNPRGFTIDALTAL
jgi:S-DNA-T family DNA segregation ATPase FtsK/SpoIIIE